jgi:hypothetical protein
MCSRTAWKLLVHVVAANVQRGNDIAIYAENHPQISINFSTPDGVFCYAG